jgi:hypothetical protein
MRNTVTPIGAHDPTGNSGAMANMLFPFRFNADSWTEISRRRNFMKRFLTIGNALPFAMVVVFTAHVIVD